MKKYVNEMNLHIKACFCVLACDYQVDDDYTKKSFGCDILVEYIIEILPEAAQKAFIAAQVVSVKAKRMKAQSIITAAVAAAFTEGFIPLPFADAAALVPTQVTMIASISAAYGVSVKKSTISAIITSLLGSTGLTFAGRTIVVNLLKLIPGCGTGIGGAISGGTAATLTAALGEAYVAIMEKLLKGEISEEELELNGVSDQIKEMFKANLKKEK